ncbi:hypothetical protein MAPG_08910 [Magnaporthiopsis poae ATCC 64411]|uniref:Uncharacterized protein n=1 Tax=Magnaporthiopsis poae (strain ATCC 64411 / 73-15) TaxID=644358 RepID=A0A0C4E8K1_MAGP6|nr:hypothetical protein MAPG_08910 [Magnaporthiopsis poae ATCC 64411]
MFSTQNRAIHSPLAALVVTQPSPPSASLQAASMPRRWGRGPSKYRDTTTQASWAVKAVLVLGESPVRGGASTTMRNPCGAAAVAGCKRPHQLNASGRQAAVLSGGRGHDVVSQADQQHLMLT